MRLSVFLASLLLVFAGVSPASRGQGRDDGRDRSPSPPLLARSGALAAAVQDPAPDQQQQQKKKGDESEDESRRWFVYRDSDSEQNHGNWTNFMQNQLITDFILAEKTDPFQGDTCVRATVKFQMPNWCGIAVSCLPDYWGEQASDAAYDLRRARKLVFYARGDKGGETIQVKVAIAGDKRFGDSARVPAATRWIRLTRSWQRYELPINQNITDLSRTVIPFAVITDRSHNTEGEITFFLDQIYFEGSGGRK